MTQLTLSDFVRQVRATGSFFKVRFIKRTTGEERIMVARTGVIKYLAGGESAYDFAAKNLLPVYDMDKAGYRCIPLDGILDITWNGKVWTLKGTTLITQ